jgi:hypothetical protein
LLLACTDKVNPLLSRSVLQQAAFSQVKGFFLCSQPHHRRTPT